MKSHRPTPSREGECHDEQVNQGAHHDHTPREHHIMINCTPQLVEPQPVIQPHFVNQADLNRLYLNAMVLFEDREGQQVGIFLGSTYFLTSYSSELVLTWGNS